MCWSLDLIKAAGQPDKIVVHADVDIPGLAVKVAMDFSQNTDRIGIGKSLRGNDI